MPVSEAQKKATAKYSLKAYDRVELKVKKAKKKQSKPTQNSRAKV